MKYPIHTICFSAFRLLLPIMLAAVFVSCEDKYHDEWLRRHTEELDKISKARRALFVVNEGNFLAGNASLSFYDIGNGEVENDVFFRKNGFPLGDVAQSMTFMDSLAFIVVNNSGKVVAINKHTFEYKGKITGLLSPRYMHIVNPHRAYITDLYAKSVAIVDPLGSNYEIAGIVDGQIQGKISVDAGETRFNQHSTEEMLVFGPYVLVNCWSYDNKVLLIDSRTDSWTSEITTRKQPNSMVLDKNNKLWVLCDGGVEGSAYGKENPALQRLDPTTGNVEITFEFPMDSHPISLVCNASRDTLYFIDRHVFCMPVSAHTLPGTPFLVSPYEGSNFSGFYTLAVDPVSSEVYVADALDFVQPGWVYRLRSDGSPVDTFQTGIAPGSICFR